MSAPGPLNPIPAVHQEQHVNNPPTLAFASQQLRQNEEVVLVAVVAHRFLGLLAEKDKNYES